MQAYKEASGWDELRGYSDGKRVVRALKGAGIFDEPKPASSDAKPASSDDKIKNITINLTNLCNYRCSFCYNNPSTDTLAPEEVVEFLREIKSSCARDASVMILGGEPLLKPALLTEALKTATRLYRSVLISTNGSLIVDDLARLFRKLKVEVQVSLDSASVDFHDEVRGKGAWQKAISGIKKLAQARAYTILSMVVSQSNIAELKDYLALGRSLGVNEVRFIPLRPIGRALESGLKPPSLVELVLAIEGLKETRDGKKMLKRDFASTVRESCQYSYRKQSCGAGSDAIFLNADGQVYPCVNLVETGFSFGNIREQNLVKILEGVKRQAFVESHVVSNYDGCRRCVIRFWCAGGCRGETLANSGSMLSRGHSCKEYREAFLRSMWLAGDRA